MNRRTRAQALLAAVVVLVVATGTSPGPDGEQMTSLGLMLSILVYYGVILAVPLLILGVALFALMRLLLKPLYSPDDGGKPVGERGLVDME